MTITPEQLTIYSAQVVDVYRALENEIFRQVARRLKFKPNESMIEWQVRALQELGMLNNKVIKELSAVSGVTEERITKMFQEVGNVAITDIDKFVEKYGYEIKSATNIGTMLEAFVKQGFLEVDNLVNQTLLTTNFGNTQLTLMFQDIINRVQAEFNAGFLTRDQALEKVIKQWADKGIPSTFTDKGGHTWSLERYADTVLKSTLNNTYNELKTSRMEEYGIHTVVMTTLIDAADRCARCQGKVLDMRMPSQTEYPSIYEFGYGLPGGTLGVNCRHSIIPFIPGVNTNNQPQIDPRESVIRSKARQHQRDLERAIRKTKKDIIITVELDSPNLQKYKERLRNQQAKMREHIKEHEWLGRDYKREKVYTPKETLLKR